MTKTCSKCKLEQDVNNFWFRNKKTGCRRTICKTCRAAYLRSHYKRDKSKYLENSRVQNKKIVERNVGLLMDYLKEHPCVDCGEKDPVVLTFDHVRGHKKKAVGSMIRNSSWETIEIEIAKCEVRCGNCHMRRTAKQFGWLKLRSLDG